jgi:hypothetical protein
MIYQENLQNVGYIGFPKKLSLGNHPVISSREKFLEIVYESIKINFSLGIRIFALDVTQIKNPEIFFNFHLDEENPKILERIEETSNFISKNSIRIIFIVSKDFFIGSQLEGVPEKSALLLEGMASFLDYLDSKKSSIVIRVGSAYGNRKHTLSSFCNRILDLSESCRNKISVVNDDKPSLFSVTDLLSGFYYKIGLPITFKFLNHFFNDGGLSVRESFFLCCSTWNSERKPILIHSEPLLEDEQGYPVSTKPRDFLSRRIPTFGLNTDILIDSPEYEDSCIKYQREKNSYNPYVINRK